MSVLRPTPRKQQGRQARRRAQDPYPVHPQAVFSTSSATPKVQYLALAKTPRDLVMYVPRQFGALADVLVTSTYRLARERADVRRASEGLQAAAANWRKAPSTFTVKPPAIEFHSSYLKATFASEADPVADGKRILAATTFDPAIESYVVKQINASIAAKKAEFEWYDAKLKHDSVIEDWKGKVKQAYDVAGKGIAIVAAATASSSASMALDDGSSSSATIPKALKDDYETLLGMLPELFTRSVLLAERDHSAKEDAAKRTREIAKAAAASVGKSKDPMAPAVFAAIKRTAQRAGAQAAKNTVAQRKRPLSTPGPDRQKGSVKKRGGLNKPPRELHVLGRKNSSGKTGGPANAK